MQVMPEGSQDKLLGLQHTPSFWNPGGGGNAGGPHPPHTRSPQGCQQGWLFICQKVLMQVFAFLLVCPKVTAQKLLENPQNSERGEKKPTNHKMKCLCQGHGQLKGKSYRSHMGVSKIVMCFKIFRNVNFLIQDVQESVNPPE